jgi:hypothetical protein
MILLVYVDVLLYGAFKTLALIVVKDMVSFIAAARSIWSEDDYKLLQ